MEDGERDGRQGKGTAEDGSVGRMQGEEEEEEEEEKEKVREMMISMSSSVFPGFRFSPTDEELLSYYLKKKIKGCDKGVRIIPELDICRYEPWELPGHSIIQSDNEWFFFSSRGKKYPKGSQSRRTTKSGYWKATGKERNLKSGSNVIGRKRTLVFHTGRPRKSGERTEWIMHEYCMDGTSQDSMVVCRLRRNSDFHLNDVPRRHLEDQRDLSDGLVSGDIPLADTDDGAKVVDSRPNECTSSNNSHSNERNDSESELNHGPANASSQIGSSSFDKFCDGQGEDEWFADIMKDDILKLDEVPLSTSQILVPLVAKGLEMQVKSKPSTMFDAVPSQGTADRRIRLRKKRAEIQQEKPLEVADEGNHASVVSVCTNMVDAVVQHLSISFFLVFLTLLVLLAPLLGKSWRV